MSTLPNPNVTIEFHSGFTVVRDDLLLGGTKIRALPALIKPGHEYVYASPVYGHAQVALAVTCQAIGAKATIFTPKRNVWHAQTVLAAQHGADIHQIAPGYLSQIQSAATQYSRQQDAILLKFGFDSPEFAAALSNAIRALPIPTPHEVWCAAGSGALTRSLQIVWPNARHNAVIIGKLPYIGLAKGWVAPERFAQNALLPPPFPSCSNYDAKVWQFVLRHASPGALIWNVAA